METKIFTGFLSSSTSPGNLSLTVSSLTKALISAAALYAVVAGLDVNAVTSQVQAIIDLIATAVPAALLVWHTIATVEGLAIKLWYYLAAKPAVTVPTAIPQAVPTVPVV